MSKILKNISLIMVIIFLISLLGCNTKNNNKIINLVSDSNFEHGFTVAPTGKGNEYGKLKKFSYNNTITEEPFWEIAQHSCNKSFYNGKEVVDGNKYIYTDAIDDSFSKELVYDKDTKELQLNIDASKDYISPRKDGETWPHFLVQQGFVEDYTLGDFSSLYLNINFMITKMDNMMGLSFNPYLHSAQFQLYFVVRSLNSADLSSQFWFGMPFFDYRDTELKGLDGAMDTGTDMFISSMGNEAYMTELAQVNKKVEINYNILPEIEKALNYAQERGFMTSSTIDELYLVNMNLGWEIPGTFDVGVNISDFSLNATLKETA